MGKSSHKSRSQAALAVAMATVFAAAFTLTLSAGSAYAAQSDSAAASTSQATVASSTKIETPAAESGATASSANAASEKQGAAESVSSASATQKEAAATATTQAATSAEAKAADSATTKTTKTTTKKASSSASTSASSKKAATASSATSTTAAKISSSKSSSSLKTQATKTYTVRFYDACGNVAKTQKVKSGKNAKAPKLTKMAHRTLKGWDTSFKKVKSNLYVHPIYKDSKKIYRLITGFSNKYSSASAPGLVRYKQGTEITSAASGSTTSTSKDRIIAYTSNPDGSGTRYNLPFSFKMPAHDVYMYPVYASASKSAKITIKHGRDMGATARYALKGGQIEVSNLSSYSYDSTTAGYTLVGYSTKANGKGKFYGLDSTYTVPKKDATLYGVWKKNTKRLHVVANFTKGTNADYYVPAGYKLPVTMIDSYHLYNSYNDRSNYGLKSLTTKKNGKGTKYAYYTSGSTNTTGAASYISVGKKGLTLYAQWKKLKTIKYLPNYKKSSASAYTENVSLGSDTVSVSGYFYRSGYKLTGWSTKANGKGTYYDDRTNINKPTKNMKLYAVWKKYNTKVTVKAGDKKSSDNTLDAVAGYDVQLYGSNYSSLHEGKYHAGYNAKKNGSAAATYLHYGYITAKSGKKGLALYQQFKKGAAVAWKYNYTGAKGNYSKDTVKPGSYISISEYGPSRDDYAFVGWSKSKSGKVLTPNTYIKVSKNTTLYAKWAKKSLTIKFNKNGGSYVSSASVKVAKGVPIGYLSDASRTGYTFVGWNTKKNGKGTGVDRLYVPKKSTTLYAQWQKAPVVTCYTNGGTGTTYKSTYSYSSTVYLDSTHGFAKSGKLLAGWNTKKNGKGIGYALADHIRSLPAGSLKLYAQWKKPTGKLVSFIADGKTVKVAAIANRYNIISSVTEPTREDYYFSSWNTKANGKGSTFYSDDVIYVPKKGLKLYAQWRKKETVTLNPNNAVSGANNETKTLKLGGTSKSGRYIDLYNYSNIKSENYYLLGWSESADAKTATYSRYGTYYFDEAGAKTTLYAVWAKKTVVTLDSNGGSGAVETIKLDPVDNRSANLSNYAVSKTGSTLLGWATSASATSVLYDADDYLYYSDLDEDTTLYAVWEQES